MKKKYYLIVLVFSIITVLAAGMGTIYGQAPTKTPAGKFPPVMKVGAILELTGNWAWAGKWKSQAVHMGIDELNASGEFPWKFELVVVDHASGDAKKSAAGMRQLVDIHHVPYTITGFETVTLAAREIGAPARVVVINPGGIAPVLMNKPYLHNTRPMGPQMSVPMAELLIEKYRVKRLAVTYWADEGGWGHRDASFYFAPKWGVEIVAHFGHEPLIPDFRSMLARVKAAKPDALGIWSIGNDVGYIVKQAKEMGMDIPMGTVLGINPVMIEVAGEKNLKGLYDCSQYFNPKSDLPFTQKFVKNYTARYKEVPEQLAANYYEAVMILRECIRHVLAKGGNPFDGGQLEEAIQTIKIFPSLYGKGQMEMKPDGSIVKPVAITQYQGGTAKDAVLIKEVTPPPMQIYPKYNP